ncbi:Uncharacterised protein [Metamycoplasma cloacale]|uniref:Uncharacterized protein n=1 Tax=Metamycoplasma cloacale TaxID=92401 RepID=A0A2Z4LLQ8_9BACT|nr:hypothetical protein [Metamycoplasma cloacale]AWX42655.1 hypothetical protein DK849_00980 [Metamycoplasma cloacale]VEU79545.1 Uncharacterised protein [Metamycoplasma cloacale]
MKRRKLELSILKKPEIKSLWFWIFVMIIILLGFILLAYMGIVLKNNYENASALEKINDTLITSLIGIVIGLGLVIFTFICLNVTKKLSIKDFFDYYCYLHSLRNQSKLILMKDKRIVDFYTTKNNLTRTEFIDVLANIFGYQKSSLEYKNLVNEVVADFAKHLHSEVKIEALKKQAIHRAIWLQLVIPFSVNIILIILITIYNLDRDSLKALSRFLIILINMIFVISTSLFVYEIVMAKKIKDIKSYNDHHFLSFNNYKFKNLNSNWVIAY